MDSGSERARAGRRPAAKGEKNAKGEKKGGHALDGAKHTRGCS